MTKPITPEEAEQNRVASIPEFVIQAVNELLTMKFRNGRAILKQKDIVEKIKLLSGGSYDIMWLDFEPLYEQAGWKVVYDKPGWNESYDAYFEFTKRK